MARTGKSGGKGKAPARPAKAGGPSRPTSSRSGRRGKTGRSGARRPPSLDRAKGPSPAPPSATAPAPPSGPAAPLRPVEGLSEEEQIESAKYIPRHEPPKRLFEEERFLFPETYGRNRVRLLVKDPEWLFAHWDVDPKVFSALRKDLGDRTVALSQLTLRIADPRNGGDTVILLPKGARTWYVRADSSPRSYRAELGLTLPSGEFRPLAESNTVTTPRVGPAPQRATRRVNYKTAEQVPLSPPPAEAAAPPGRWEGERVVGEAAPAPRPGRKGKKPGGPGGASDAFRR